jgi:hypothetical protein
MLLLVAVVGVALVALGALVLLRFPDRPGGRVRLLGLEVSSIGAGLPVVALGVLAVVTAGVQQGDNGWSSTAESTGGGGGGAAARPAPSNMPACVSDFFDERPVVPNDRRRTLPAEAEDVDVLGPAEQKRDEFGLVLADKRTVIGAAKMSYDVDATQYRFDGLVDGRCRRAAWIAPDVPGANPSTVNNHSTLRLALGDAEYALELKASGTEVELELHRFER